MALSAAQIRRNNFIALVNAAGGVTEFANTYDLNPDYIRQLRRGKDVPGGRNIGDRSARRIEQLVGKPVNWLDQAHPAKAARRGARIAEPQVPEEQYRNGTHNDIQAIRYALGALFVGLSATRPDEAAEVAKILRTSAPPEFLDRGLVFELLESVDRAVAVAKGRRRVKPAAGSASS